MIDTDTLFLRTLDDIEARLSQRDPYEILLIAGPLRKLFLDDHPLVDRVNKNHRAKLSFETTVSSDPRQESPAPTFWSVQDGIDPDTAPPFKKRQVLTRDQFFQSLVAIVGGHSYTIRDIVLFEANVVGAVHAGAPKTDKESALHQIDSQISVGGYGSALRQLLAIARVCLKTLSPLRQAVAKV
jgi:hypothetical protein